MSLPLTSLKYLDTSFVAMEESNVADKALKKEKKDKKEKKEKRKDREEENVEEIAPSKDDHRKRAKQDHSTNNENAEEGIGSGNIKDLWKNGEQAWRENSLDADYLLRNPDGITRLFCGNLKLDVTEEALRAHIPNITYIRWQKDKTTKEFYGSTFLEMKDPKAASVAVSMDRTKFMGRPLKIYYCPPRPGDIWPPVEKGGINSGKGHVSNAGGAASGKDRNTRSKTPKPPGGKKLYMGNLAYNIDDDTIVSFFKDCGEMRGLRWLVNTDTGAFRGGGFVEFTTTEAADKAILLDGADLLGRTIRLDWTL